MKNEFSQSLSRRARAVGFSLLAGFAAVSQLHAVGDPKMVPVSQDIKITAPMQTIPASSIKTFTKPALKFISKQILNPSTGKPTNPDSVITFSVVSDGRTVMRKMKASEYYDMLNSNEKEFNKLGYTMYDGASTPTLLQEIPIESSVLQGQVNSAPQSIKPRASSSQMSSRYVVPAPNLSTVPRTTADLKPGVMPVTVHHDEHKKWQFGDAKSFLAFLNVGSKLDASFYATNDNSTMSDKNSCHFHAHGEAGATVLGINFNVLEGKADFNVPPGTAPMTAKADIEVLGKAVWSLDESAPQSWSKHDDFSKKLSYGVQFYVAVGPIPVRGEVGVTGKAGLKYNATLTKSGLTATATPYLNVSGYGQAGVDLGIAGAGVGASLTVCSADVNLSNSTILNLKNSKLVIQDNFTIDYDVHFLDGRVYAYAYVMVPQFSLTNPIKEKRFEHNFFKWSGYKLDGTIVDVNGTIPLQ